MRGARGTFTIGRMLLLAQLREQPLRLLVTVLAIALGVALGVSVYLINGAALNEFGLATKRLVGEADVIVRGSRDGFAEELFVRLAQDTAVSMASPVIELEVALPGRRDPLKVLGIDPFRAAAMQPTLMGDLGSGMFELFRLDGIYLSGAAAEDLQLRRGDLLQVIVGSSPKSLVVLGILSAATYPQPLGLMDIASAQWTFKQIGRLNRVDVRLRQGIDTESYRRELRRVLPVGVLAIAPQVERDRARTVTRAYRVNLNMLALVALWTGAFLVFSTQSLAVLRRQRPLAVLRALGVTRGQLQRALVGEGVMLGLTGSLLGLVLGTLIAATMLQLLTGDLGNGQLRTVGAELHATQLPLLAFFVLGTAVAGLGAWLPARSAAHHAPAAALKGGDVDYIRVARSGWHWGAILLGLGAVLAWLPPVSGLPLFGYASVAALLFGAVLLIPTLTVQILRRAPCTHHVVLDTAVAQLRENIGLSTLSLASIIASFSLMVAMAIMVYSFRMSFDQWLGKLLPADLQLREPQGSDTAFWSAADQAQLAAVKGVARAEFRRSRQLLLNPARAPVTLVARGADAARTVEELPLVRSTALPRPTSVQPAWISEALQDLYGYQLGDSISLPLAGRLRPFKIAGIWRDYARMSGTVVISRPAYIDATGDTGANEGSLWLQAQANPTEVEAAVRACFARGDSLEIVTSTALRERSLNIFDRAFAITYVLEAIAVLIGLTGVSLAASSTALARRAEFGMLRHIGMRRQQVLGMLATEGMLTSIFGVLCGLALGSALSLVLVYVVNRQSFNWSIDLAVPYRQLVVLCVTLIGAAAITAIASGRAALNQDAVRAVREDW